jgi:hypothetical protein
MNNLEQRAEEICRWISTFTIRPMDKDDLDYILTILRQTREEAYAKAAEEIRYHCGKVESAFDAEKLAQRIEALASVSEPK